MQLTKLKRNATCKSDDEGLLVELNHQVAELTEQLRVSTLHLQDHQEQVEILTGDLQAKTTEAKSVEAKYDTAANFLVQCMEDVKRKIVTVVSKDKEGKDRPEIMVLPGEALDTACQVRNVQNQWSLLETSSVTIT